MNRRLSSLINCLTFIVSPHLIRHQGKLTKGFYLLSIGKIIISLKNVKLKAIYILICVIYLQLIQLKNFNKVRQTLSMKH